MKAKLGRPKLEAKARRSLSIHIRFTAEQHAAITKQADVNAKSVSSWARDVLLRA